MDQSMQILTAARDAWLAGADFRMRRQRYKNYTYGDQWSDKVATAKGSTMTERDYLLAHDCKPLTNNMIRQIVKVVVGRYRNRCEEQQTYKVNGPERQYVAENSLAELDCRMLEEFLISGFAAQRISVDSRSYGTGLWIDNVDPRLMFVNPFKDPRGRDIELIGMMHDLSFGEIVARFAQGDSAFASMLARIYGRDADDVNLAGSSVLGRATEGADDFFYPEPGRCRLIEVWTLDCHTSRSSAGNAGSDIDFVWWCRWFAPDGTLISSYPSPYAHHSHPFAIKLYPLTDGEVHSFVEDVIDQQRYINRLIVMTDKIMSTSAKGVLLFPESQRAPHVPWEDIADAWSRTSGVIPITGMGDTLPQQVVTNTSDLGTYKLLALQMKLFDNISGIGDAIAGRSVSPSTSTSMYESQLQSSTIALADLLDSLSEFCRQRDFKAENCI